MFIQLQVAHYSPYITEHEPDPQKKKPKKLKASWKNNQTPRAFYYSNYTKQKGNILPLCNHRSSQGLSGDQKQMQESQSGATVLYRSFSLYQATASLKIQVSKCRSLRVCSKLVLK